MIVYGDPSFIRPLPELVGDLADQLISLGAAPSLDELRRVLIQAGQVEQAAEDAEDVPEALRARFRETTDRIARTFVAHFLGKQVQNPTTTLNSRNVPDLAVRVKVPEGFAFYSLFPEQYVSATHAWTNANPQTSAILVVGVRSIGTTLSAVVSAALNEVGRAARRITVRPTGHPFDRQLQLDPDAVTGCTHAIIVDEGPGASGSSMAAAARALMKCGLHPDQIAFFPGHGGEPGAQASQEVREWWARIPRYSVPLDELRWNGRSLTEQLAERTCELLGGNLAVDRVEDFAAGLWRKVLNLPAEVRVFPLFERTKFRCVLSDGRAMLWKFGGFAPHSGAETDEAFGFVGLPWINGTNLTAGDATPEVLGEVGAYILSTAGPPLDSAAQSAAFDRLAEMLYWNTRESLGEEAAERAKRISERARALVGSHSNRCYGDGRLAPWGWVRTPGNRLIKVDAAGHASDHTMIGRQPLIWDVAGAIVEWGLDQPAIDLLLSGAGCADVSADWLNLHRHAYAAFRVGMSVMCQVDPSFYVEQLKQM